MRLASFAAVLASSSLLAACSPASLWTGSRISKATDESSGKAQVRLEEMALAVTAATQVYLAARWDERKPDDVVLDFRIARAECVKPGASALFAVVDGKQMVLAGLGENLAMELAPSMCELTLEATLSRGAFDELVASPTVVLRVDSSYFRLLAHHLEALKQLAAALPARSPAAPTN